MSLIVQLHPAQLPHQIGYRHGFSAGQRVCASASMTAAICAIVNMPEI
jgi:hypothetical protein